MKFLGYLVLIGASSLTLGCVSMYKAPENIPTATVVFVTNGNGVKVQAFDDENCKRNPNGNRVAYFFGNMFDSHSGAAKEIAATKPFVYSFVLDAGVTTSTHCAISTAFQPEPGKKYQAVFNLTGGQCLSALRRVIANGNGQETLVEEPTAKRLDRTCIVSGMID